MEITLGSLELLEHLQVLEAVSHSNPLIFLPVVRLTDSQLLKD